jgi:diadenosine tetraphosphate (Ap4A) HIT family hydrolase
MERPETSDRVCDGCEIVAARTPTPGGVILDDSHWHVTHVGAPGPLVRGMLVLRARRHVIHLADLTPKELEAAAALIGCLSKALRDHLNPVRLYCWFFGEGSPHAHFVLMPRFEGMPAGDPLASLTEVIVDRKHQIDWREAAETAAALRDALHGIPAT